MRLELVRATLVVTTVAAWVAACGITLETAPEDGVDGGGTSTSSTGGNTASSSGTSGLVDSGHDTGTTSSTSGSTSSGGPDACVPLTQETACAGKACAVVTDPCNEAVFHCDTCTTTVGPRATCNEGTSTCDCAPDTCTGLGKNCGMIQAGDGCGSALDCGNATCGGGNNSCGADNVCHCTPDADPCAGKNCGDVPNGCGQNVHCGDCAAPQTCGGGPGNPANVCGCTPKTLAEVCRYVSPSDGQNHPFCTDRSTDSDGCGGTVRCSQINCNGAACDDCLPGRKCCH